ncbi:hypothetical protein UFOVP276_108 [uncultured Caudovirales phage]|uniref:Inorganic pyrophosphatase domain-containing protein n=1 Tax=uncultured Caudovirales phage TaxID=2100421 RepID=A0A6J5L814_9CAUD|nr:hypothetical protein UFOVP127_2 [uncultured Caudovirales phage]CAB4135152.1 hypothetical protein UFOVP276_108 [uncultured Caudovirales phage]
MVPKAVKPRIIAEPFSEDQAPGISGAQLAGTRMDAIQGDAAGAVEKGADFDGGGFLGDGTKLQPAINQIWKAGHVIKRAAYSTFGIEDLDATYQSRLNPSAKDNRATDAGTREPSLARRGDDIPIDVAHTDQSHLGPINPGGSLQTTSDVGVQGAGVGSGDMDDVPVSEVEEPGPQGARIRQAKGLNKRASIARAWLSSITNPELSKVAQELCKHSFTLEGRMDFQGLPIAIEHTAGSIRRGVDKDGHAWETVFRFAYGYIDGTKGADDEGLDVFVGPNVNADKAFVVDQKKPETGKYDEQKIMLGFDGEDEAKQAYLDHYDDPKFFDGISTISMDNLRSMVAKKKNLVKIASLLRKQAYDAMDEGPEPPYQGPPIQFKMPGKVMTKASDAEGQLGRLESATNALFEPLEPLQPSNPLAEVKRDLTDTRKAVKLVRKILNDQPLI